MADETLNNMRGNCPRRRNSGLAHRFIRERIERREAQRAIRLVQQQELEQIMEDIKAEQSVKELPDERVEVI